MNSEDIRTKTDDELKKILLDLRKAQLNARFQKSQGTLENTAQIRNTRRTIARVKTELGARKRGETAQAKPAKAKKAEKKAAPKKTKAKTAA
ncbi:MAG: 50S ribosomal protein L29 [Alphaproteobacteria bacterium]|nr:50S ribosomal protein L29 [Alphaproteobacteria bacterium]MCB9974494.1 50S ribosomal protein L29 [Rhodospirillales bacterium]